MNRTSPRALVIGAALSAMLRAVGMNVVNVETTKHGHRIAKRPRLNFGYSPSKPNGGQRRKRAIKAAHLRKHGRVRFGRFQ